MRIVDIETYLVGNPWKNWVFLRLLTDEGIHGIGEGSLGHLSKTVETAIHEIKPLILGLDVFQTELLVTRLQRHVYADGGQIKMCAISAIEIACWDAIGKALRQPIYNLVGGACRQRIRAYANGWYRCDRKPDRLQMRRCFLAVCALGGCAGGNIANHQFYFRKFFLSARFFLYHQLPQHIRHSHLQIRFPQLE